MVNWESHHHSLTTVIRAVHKETANQTIMLLTITEACMNPGSPQEQRKNYPAQGDLMRTNLHGPTIWKVMPRNMWNGIVNSPKK